MRLIIASMIAASFLVPQQQFPRDPARSNRKTHKARTRESEGDSGHAPENKLAADFPWTGLKYLSYKKHEVRHNDVSDGRR